MAGSLRSILNTTKGNIKRNIWLSIATVIVTTIVFATTSLFISVAILANRAVSVTQQQTQLLIFFQTDAKEEDILKVRDKLAENDAVETIKYVDQKEALSLYLAYNSEEPELTENISEDWLPASIEIRARSLEELDKVTEDVRKEQKANPIIEDVLYQEDVVDSLKKISTVINFASLGIVILFTIITIALIVITISFNIMTHKSEIEIMHLVGSTDRYIKTPFILEGVLYTILGTFFAASMIVIPWYIVMYYGKDSNAYFIMADALDTLSLSSLKSFNPIFVSIYYLIHLLVGFLIGYSSSLFAVRKYLNLKEK